MYYYLIESIDGVNAENNSGKENSGVDTVTIKPLKKGRSLLDSDFVEDVHDNLWYENTDQ